MTAPTRSKAAKRKYTQTKLCPRCNVIKAIAEFQRLRTDCRLAYRTNKRCNDCRDKADGLRQAAAQRKTAARSATPPQGGYTMHDAGPFLEWLDGRPRPGLDAEAPGVARAIRRVRVQGRVSDLVVDRVGSQYDVPDLLDLLYPA